MSMGSAQVSQAAFDRFYTLELLELRDDRAVAKAVARAEMGQPPGGPQAGVYATIAARLVCLGTEHALGTERRDLALLSSQASYLRPLIEGGIHAVALARHRGRTTWVWEVELSDERGRLCVFMRMTIAVGEAAGG